MSGSRFLGVNRPGAYASHVLVPHPKYLVDSSGIDDAFAATLACSGLTTYSAAAKLPELGPKDWVAVIGCGGLGLVCISVLRARGVKNIIACDIDETKLEAAKKLGAKLTLDTRAPDAAQKLQALAMGQLAGAIDLVGMPATVALGLAALRKGGRLVLCGLFGGELVHPLPPFAQRAIGLVGSYVGNPQELKEVVALAKKKKLKPTPVSVRPGRRSHRDPGEPQGRQGARPRRARFLAPRAGRAPGRAGFLGEHVQADRQALEGHGARILEQAEARYFLDVHVAGDREEVA